MVSRVVGDIQKSGRNALWTIPDFFTSYEDCNRFYSPTFSGLRILLYLDGYPDFIREPHQDIGWIYMSIQGNPHKPCFINVYYTLSIKSKSGDNYKTTTTKHYITSQWYPCGVVNTGVEKFLQMSQLLEDKHRITRTNSLSISCTVDFDLTAIDIQPMTYKESVERSAESFKTLLLSKESSYVTLKVKGQEFRVNKEILAARSFVFSAMFPHDFAEKSSGIVDIDDCEPDIFLDFLISLHSGKAGKMTTSNALALYTTADKYIAKELKEECLQFMKDEITVESFCDFMTLALEHCELILLETCSEFFTENAKSICVTPRWKKFLKENADAANELILRVLYKNG